MRVLLTGKLVIGQPPVSVNCMIRDLTDHGARVVLAPNVVAPSRGWLINLRTGLAHDSVVAWRAAGLLGLDFIETIDLTGPIPGSLDHLHRLWVECAGR